MPPVEIFQTGIAAAVFAAVFLLKTRVLLPAAIVGDPRRVISFSAGMSVAYIFVRLMPELHTVRRAFVESVSIPLRYEGMAIYFVALVGFLVFYALDHLQQHLREGVAMDELDAAFKVHVGGFAAYVWLTAYLLMHGFEQAEGSLTLYVVAMTFHFLAVDHALEKEHGAAYERVGRFVLAGMAAIGWTTGLLCTLPPFVLALCLAFISGGVIMNSMLMELPSERDGRFWPFMTGGVVYGLILLPLG